MTNAWRFEVTTTPNSTFILAGVGREELVEFMMTKYPGHILTVNNAESWVLRYAIEEKLRLSDRILRIDISPIQEK